MEKGKHPPQSNTEKHASDQNAALPPEEPSLQGAAGPAGEGMSEAASPQTPPPTAEELERLRRELAAAQEARCRAEAELAAAHEAKLRALAELENVRRRSARQMEEERRYAFFPLMRDILPVLDNLRRAVDSAQKNQDLASLTAGVQLVCKQLQEVLQRHHCVEIKALGAPFDPNLHHAVSQVAASDHPAGTVVEVAQPGFRLHDRVVRPSLVVVAAAPAASEPPSQEKTDHPPGNGSPGQAAPCPPSDASSQTQSEK